MKFEEAKAKLLEQLKSLEELPDLIHCVWEELEAKEMNMQMRIDQKMQAWEKQMENAREVAKNVSDVIHLNIGGTPFITSKSTLLAEEGSFFYAMLHSGHWAPDESGEYFVDRDPKFFQCILNYWRSGRLDGDMGIRYDELESSDRRCLFNDIDFYQIDSVRRRMHNLSFVGNTNWKVEDRTAECIAGCYTPIVSAEILAIGVKWGFSYEATDMEMERDVMIGVAPANLVITPHTERPHNLEGGGWYVWLHNHLHYSLGKLGTCLPHSPTRFAEVGSIVWLRLQPAAGNCLALEFCVEDDEWYTVVSDIPKVPLVAAWYAATGCKLKLECNNHLLKELEEECNVYAA